jgi:hypothetical protein
MLSPCESETSCVSPPGERLIVRVAAVPPSWPPVLPLAEGLVLAGGGLLLPAGQRTQQGAGDAFGVADHRLPGPLHAEPGDAHVHRFGASLPDGPSSITRKADVRKPRTAFNDGADLFTSPAAHRVRD